MLSLRNNCERFTARALCRNAEHSSAIWNGAPEFYHVITTATRSSRDDDDETRLSTGLIAREPIADRDSSSAEFPSR